MFFLHRYFYLDNFSRVHASFLKRIINAQSYNRTYVNLTVLKRSYLTQSAYCHD